MVSCWCQANVLVAFVSVDAGMLLLSFISLYFTFNVSSLCGIFLYYVIDAPPFKKYKLKKYNVPIETLLEAAFLVICFKFISELIKCGNVSSAFPPNVFYLSISR